MGDGITTILYVNSSDRLSVVHSLTTEKGAQTIVLDEQTHKVYLLAAKTELEMPSAEEGEHHWPKIIPIRLMMLVNKPAN